jgi:hypothetical protein
MIQPLEHSLVVILAMEQALPAISACQHVTDRTRKLDS